MCIRDRLETVFTDVEARQVWFDNPLTKGKSAATIYVGTRLPGQA